MKKAWLYLILFLFAGCQSSLKSNPKKNKEIEANEQDNIAKEITKSYETNRMTETQSNQAFLIGKFYEFQGDLTKAEKMFEIDYKFNHNISAAVNLIQVRLALKKIPEAKEITNHASILFPDSVDLLILKIQISQLENDLGQIVKLLEKGHKQFPKNEQIAILFAYYNKQKAKQILENFMTQNPDSPSVLLKLSYLYYEERKYDQALKYAKKSFYYDNDNLDTLVMLGSIHQNLKNVSDAEKYFKLAFEKDLENNLNAQHYINILLLQNKQQEALSVLLKLESSSDASIPFPPEFNFELARILIINEDYAGAKKRLESLLSNEKGSSIDSNQIHFFLGYCLENLHQFAEALTSFEKVNFTSRAYHLAVRESIITKINAKMEKEALADLEKFVPQENSFIEDTLFKASVLFYFKKQKESLELLKTAITKNPNEKLLYFKQLEIYVRQKKEVEFVIDEGKKILKKWPDTLEVMNLMAYYLVSENTNLNYAESLLKKCITKEPKNPYYLDSYGLLLSKKNDLLSAQRYFIEALKYRPNEPVILVHYADVLKALKNDLDAEKNLEKARTIISNMLIYNLESDDELLAIAKRLGTH